MNRPYFQALFFLLLTLLVLCVWRPKTANAAWMIAAFLFFFFLTANTVMLWFAANAWRYFLLSLGCSVGYVFLIGFLIQKLEPMLKFEGSGESAMAFLVVIFHPFAMLLLMLVKWLLKQ